MNCWVQFPGGKWHQGDHDSRTGQVSIDCMGSLLPARVLQMKDYRSLSPNSPNVCRKPNCQREVEP